MPRIRVSPLPRQVPNIAIVMMGFCLLFTSKSALAQLGGENIRGDVGMKSGSQAPPGWYLGDVFYFYDTDEVRSPNGTPFTGPQLHLFGNFFLFNYVSNKKLFG